MSSGIMERNLPVAESLGEGDMVRIVTSAGNSKQIDASEIGGGGGVLIITEEYDAGTDVGTLDKTWKEIHDAFISGIPCILYYPDGDDYTYIKIDKISYVQSNCPYSVSAGEYIYSTETETGYPSSGECGK